RGARHLRAGQPGLSRALLSGHVRREVLLCSFAAPARIVPGKMQKHLAVCRLRFLLLAISREAPRREEQVPAVALEVPLRGRGELGTRVPRRRTLLPGD